MDKLSKLKEWFTVPAAAKHLTSNRDKEISEADVFQLALDGHIKLSVNFVNQTTAQRTKRVKESDITIDIPGIDGKPLKIAMGLPVGNGEYLVAEDEVFRLGGVWDLAMIGSERIYVMNKLQEKIGGPPVDLICADGAFVESKGDFFKLVEKFTYDTLPDSIMSRHEEFLNQNPEFRRPDHTNYHPAETLPNDCMLVVRTEVLEDIERFLSENSAKEVQKATRTDALAVEIDDIIQKGTSDKIEHVWKELINRCNPECNVCLRTEETDKGLVICWRGKNGKMNRLTKIALEGRLRNRKSR